MFVPLMLLAVLPFIQLGVSYYASMGVVGTLLILWYQRNNLPALFERFLLARLAVVLLMVIFTWGFPASFSEVLRAAREGVFYFLITGCSTWRLHPVNRSVTEAATLSRIVCAGFLVLTIIQTLFLMRGTYFGLPRGLFSQNSGVIATDLDLFYSDIRPNGTYGEPSYLGAVCLCLLFAFGPLLFKNRAVNHGSILLFITVNLSRSFSGVVFFLLMACASFWKLVRSPIAKIILVAVITAGAAMVLMTENTITSRIGRFRSGEDVSSMARVVQPLIILPDILTRSPTGIPMNNFLDLGYVPAVGTYAEELVHNALLNLILNYGWAGIAAIVLWLCVLRDWNCRLFVLLLSMQNGAVLTPDKFVLIALSLMIYNSCVAKVAAGARRRGAVREPISAPELEKPAYQRPPALEVLPWE